MNGDKFKQVVSESISFADVCKSLKIPYNGHGIKLVKDYAFSFSCDLSHFNKNDRTKNRKYKRIDKICPVCESIFEVKENHPREKTVCSRACSNSYFRSGENHPNYKENSSRRQHKLLKESIGKCTKCGYDKIIAVLQIHHIDRDRCNNSRDNLEVLCPTCHVEIHYLSRDGIFHMMID